MLQIGNRTQRDFGLLAEQGDSQITGLAARDLHALRVTYGTLLARADVSLAQAQKLMRHSTPTLTANVYVKLQMDDAREAVARIDVA